MSGTIWSTSGPGSWTRTLRRRPTSEWTATGETALEPGFAMGVGVRGRRYTRRVPPSTRGGTACTRACLWRSFAPGAVLDTRHVPSPASLSLALVLVLAGCAALQPPPEPPPPVPRTCQTLDEGELPPLDALLDPTDLVPHLQRMSPEEEDILLTLAVREVVDEIVLYPTGTPDQPGEGLWAIIVQDLLLEPLPSGLPPALRIRLTPGADGSARLEPSVFCAPALQNEAEVLERYLHQTRDLEDPGQIEATLTLSDRGGIETITVQVPEGRDELDLLARRALRFARFLPADLDGRSIPYTVRITLP